MLKAGLGLNTIFLSSESRLFTAVLPCISGRPVGSMGFGVRQGSSVGTDGRRGESGKGAARAGPRREIEAETQMEGRTEG